MPQSPSARAAAAPGLAVPGPVRALLDALVAEGHRAVLVGGCVRDLVRGAPVRDFDVASSAPPEAVLALFPRAVPVGIRHGTVMVPTATGPVDVTRFRCGDRLEDDLAHRDFTWNALAWEPAGAGLIDLFDGRADLAAGRLRAVGDPDARLAEDPLRALRAARFVAELGVRPDAALEKALPRHASALAEVARERVRAEIERLLVADGAGEGLALLQRSGAEAVLVGDAGPHAPAVVAALPAELALRLCGWLRASERPARALAALRVPRPVARDAERVLELHPVEARAAPDREAAVRRLLRRAGDGNLERLLALREAELAAGALAPEEADAVRRRLDALRRGVERVRRAGRLALRRQDLALGGREVMAILGCGPGPEVGRALAFLTECVLDDPSRNEPAELERLLRAWSAGDAAPPSAASER